MSEGSALPRPRQVTMAGWLAITASALVVVTVFESIAGLRDLETREAVERFLAEPPGDGLGLSLQGALTLLQVVSMVAAGCAAAAVILGFHVLKRSRSARLGLTVLAVPMFLSGMVAGGLLSSLVAAAAIMLWLEPARDWFDGRPASQPDRPRPERPSAARETPPPTASGPTTPPHPTPPPPHEGFGRPASDPASVTAAPPTGASAVHRERPDAVLWASILTWVFAGLVTTLMGLTALVLATSPELVMDELHRQNPEVADQGLTDGAIRTATLVVAGVTALWSTLASVFAVLVFRGVPWARVALLACAAGAGAVCLLAALQSVLMVLPLAGCAAVAWLCLRRDVRQWCARA